MLNKVARFMELNHMISRGDHIIVGISGGADSVCLLLILNELSKTRGFVPEAVHINHMIRGDEADRDEAYVAALCEKLGVRCHLVSRDVPGYASQYHMSLEEAGRKVRYEEFRKRAEIYPNAKIAVAHHGDDQAETVLYQIVRGSSLRGAGGIRPVRGNIIRPLLCVTRCEIERYLEEKNISFCVDSTNLGSDYARNKFRNKIIPYLTKEINAEAVSNINNLASDLQESYEYIYRQAEVLLDMAVTEKHRISFPVEALIKEPPVLRREAIRIAMERLSGTVRDITRKHIEAAEELLFGNVSRQVTLPYHMTALRDYEKLVICDGDTETARDFSYPFEDCTPGDFELKVCDSCCCCDGDWKIITNDYTKVLNYDKIKDTIEIRNRLPGDYITIDRNGKRKSLKEYFIDNKIPREYRDRIWLVAEGSHILWIVGYRTSEILKTDGATSRVLVVTVRRKEHEV